MSTPTRVIILALLVLAIASTIAFRRGGSPSAPAAAAAPSPGSAAVAIPRLVDIGADTCIPCKAMVPVLEALRREYAGRLQVDFIDAWKHPDQAAPFDVYGIPTQIFFDASGRELYRHLGFFSKEDILATWRKLGIRLDASGKG
jgi:thioredoxin 1